MTIGRPIESRSRPRARAIALPAPSYSIAERMYLSVVIAWDRMFRVREGMAATCASALLITAGIFLIVAAYQIKSAMGIDLVKGMHGPDLFKGFK